MPQIIKSCDRSPADFSSVKLRLSTALEQQQQQQQQSSLTEDNSVSLTSVEPVV